jgi:hypothetical protein
MISGKAITSAAAILLGSVLTALGTANASAVWPCWSTCGPYAADPNVPGVTRCMGGCLVPAKCGCFQYPVRDADGNIIPDQADCDCDNY